MARQAFRWIPGILAMTMLVSVARADTAFVQSADFDFKTLLAPPPAPDSDQGRQEIDQLLKLQDQRTPQDVKRIAAETKMTPFLFSEVLGSWFNPDDLPASAVFLANVMKESGAVCSAAKEVFHRDRPFKVDPRIKPCVEKEKTFSYPSSHSLRSMVLALTLAEIFPDQKGALIARAKLVGDDRALAGQHFPSDVAAGRILGKAIFQKMVQNPDFQSQLEKAKDECLAKEKAK
ncbi:MAG: phosphatase PAP2 family protein [Tepidisphaeraceae bacterium]|jgi:acid phosphatase (class A)